MILTEQRNTDKTRSGINRNFFLMVVVLLLGISAPRLHSQEFTYYTQYMFNGLAINPAYAGVHDYVTVNGNVREQWMGMKGAPSTQTLSAHSPVLNDQFGVGLTFINDKIGVRSQQVVSVSYAYKLHFPYFTISLGLKVGFNTVKNNFDELYLDDQDDINFMDNSTAFLPLVGTGAYLKANDYYVGLSMPQLYRFVPKKYQNEGYDQQTNIFLTAGYIFQLDRDFKIRPSIFTKAQMNGAFEMDLNANLYYKEDYCVGLTYKSFNSLALLFEIGIKKTYYIGYSYDIATSSLIRHQAGTHEFSVNVYLNRSDSPRIVNPRYF